MLPALKSWLASIENEVISLLPNEPCPQHECFHEEIVGALLFSLIHHRVEV
jgi:hypothetical protein